MSDPLATTPFLSIIVNCYNYEAFVGEAIESAQAAAGPDCEIIVVDDGSTDTSLDVIRGFDGITVITKDNGGQASALNAGFAASRGRYVHFLDADDLLVEDAVEVIRDTIPGHHMMWYAMEVLDNDHGVVSYYPSSRVPPEPNFWSDYFGKGATWLRPMSGNVFSRALLEKVFPLPEADWRICADHVALVLSAAYTGYQGSNRVINRYRFHGNNRYFSNALSTLDTHIYEDRQILKMSTHFRHFFVAGCDCLTRIEEAERYCAVLSHWFALGEMLKEDADLLDSHREDIEAASMRLFQSQRPTFWAEAGQALFRNKVDPAHLRAFHTAPGLGEIAPPDDERDLPFLTFETDLGRKDWSRYLTGGFEVWDETNRDWAFSLSQACRFAARVNALSGVIRFSMEMAADTVAGDLRLVNQDGRIAEVAHDGTSLLADIPCDWALDGRLEFYFVFEALEIPLASEWSSFDTCMTGGYMRQCRFDVPPGSHFFLPMPYRDTVPAHRYLSPIRHPAPTDATLLRLSRTPTYFGMSLAFCEQGSERLVFDIENTSAKPVCLLVQTDFATRDEIRKVADRVTLPAGFSGPVQVPISFQLFGAGLPEVALSLAAYPDATGGVLVRDLRHLVSQTDQLMVPSDTQVSFGETSMAAAILSQGWRRGPLGIAPDPEQAGDLTLQFAETEPRVIAFEFSWPGKDRGLPGPENLWININGEVLFSTLNAAGIGQIETAPTDQVVVAGWWFEPEKSAVTLSTIRNKTVSRAAPSP